jgi:hypothetical protein
LYRAKNLISSKFHKFSITASILIDLNGLKGNNVTVRELRLRIIQSYQYGDMGSECEGTFKMGVLLPLQAHHRVPSSTPMIDSAMDPNTIPDISQHHSSRYVDFC